ncbi:uncharacterized protein LY79DRAFT_686720 [Colletotrichum navitas]|uniref:Uncharacterized protein n=1 Tax=Colletotrichum navitas TaxID=681940 RepID=A0AAD8Q121_9PEZI|nr:uncharacterized protein LY79DRAFT_686720 [Colletotrichum navitas]KAK1590802.1 hypothetical protein LY79DRAFT_686720 [Colletotrichum navitas]
MSRNEESSSTEGRVVLRAQGMDEVLPRHHLNLFTSSAAFPPGQWILSECSHPHQFQAAYCVRNTHGQLVRAPMPLVNVSAVTNQQEIYDHCTVYHYDPAYQNQGGRENIYATTAIGQQEQQAGNWILPREPSNYQDVSIHPRTTGHHRPDLEPKQDCFSPTEMTFFANPPPYSSLVTTHAQANATPLGSRPAISQVMMHDLDTPSFPTKANIGGHAPHHGLSIVGDSFNDTSNAFLSPEQEEIHGLEAFSLQDSFGLDTHESSIWSADSSFDMTVPPAMLSQLHEQAFDELFCQVSEANYKVDESHVQGKVKD